MIVRCQNELPKLINYHKKRISPYSVLYRHRWE